MERLRLVLFAVLSVWLPAAWLPAQQWGDLSATFVYDGQLPKEATLTVTKDAEFCGKFRIVDESLAVNAENKGISNVFAYLYLGRSGESPRPHPSYDATVRASVKLDSNCCRFDPHVLLLRTTQTLILSNSDEIRHSCKIVTFANPPINYTIPAKGQVEHGFSHAEQLPARVSCAIHPWMSAWLLIRDNPYMASSDANGRLLIKNLPVGKWTIQFWHEKAGYLSQVNQGGKRIEWKNGRLEVDIKPGENKLGPITLEQTVFAD